MSIDERFEPVRAEYERITGVKESNHNAIMLHRISLYGAPCKRCNKSLRSPQAKLSGACMRSVQECAQNGIMAIQTRPLDAVEYLGDDEPIQAYLKESPKIALEDFNMSFLTQAFRAMVRARGVETTINSR
jgi:hypothetical protein